MDPERPVECGQCKKPAKVLYKEIIGNAVTCTQMCADCPVFQEKLHGTSPQEATASKTETGLCCSNCRTNFEAVKMGNPLGCKECYVVFGNLLVSELLAAGKIPARLKKTVSFRQGQPIHVGRTPDKPLNIPASSRLNALNEALNEALKKENYEEAAFLRDQIKGIMEKSDDSKS